MMGGSVYRLSLRQNWNRKSLAIKYMKFPEAIHGSVRGTNIAVQICHQVAGLMFEAMTFTRTSPRPGVGISSVFNVSQAHKTNPPFVANSYSNRTLTCLQFKGELHFQVKTLHRSPQFSPGETGSPSYDLWPLQLASCLLRWVSLPISSSTQRNTNMSTCLLRTYVGVKSNTF